MFDLLIKYIKEERIRLDKSRYPQLAVYHDPCNYGRKAKEYFGHAFYDEPRWIMDQCLANWMDMDPCKDAQLCCGGGGGTLLTGYNEDRLLYGKKKMDRILATTAEMIVVPCHSCHGQFNSVIKDLGIENLEVKYLWEVVADILVL
ncbi:MAG: hypothetical protein HKM93_21265 [Desulfobacteraceae bacterium]|nr:hypothetical protein [Desulfobacteraceae bacterium]